MPVHDKHVLVLHGPAHQAWAEVFNSLAQQHWIVHHCESDLCLASRLGQVSGISVLCVGSIESMTAKPGQLLAWLKKQGVICCAWATRSSAWDMIEHVQSLGVPVFTRKEAFNDWVGRMGTSRSEQGIKSVLSMPSVSDAELAALFGDDGDE